MFSHSNLVFLSGRWSERWLMAGVKCQIFRLSQMAYRVVFA